MSDEPPSNIFQFPGARKEDGSPSDDEPFKPGEFLDKYAKTIFAGVESLPDFGLEDMLKKLRQHRALAQMLIDMLETEKASRT
ncbi:hypothetical protein [Mesorhizobium sp. M0909]|uniref:hypothetical protein n=1 Tax=Mesorhizobium sp. M0909 TaxID=2957024 RepID=UPI00333B31FC